MNHAGVTFTPAALANWPLYANDDGRVSCHGGCDPEWTWDGIGRRPTLAGWLLALLEHIRTEHADGAWSTCT